MPKARKRATPPPAPSADDSDYPWLTGGVGFQACPPGASCERCGSKQEIVLIVVVAREETPDVPSISAAMTLCSACLAEAYHRARGVAFAQHTAAQVRQAGLERARELARMCHNAMADDVARRQLPDDW